MAITGFKALREWAAGELGTDVQQEARLALLRKVRDANWTPPVAMATALDVLEKRPIAPKDAGLELARQRREQQLRDSVEAFAKGFFDWPVGQRLEHFENLLNHCGSNPCLRRRLEKLSPFLDPQEPAIPAERWREVELLRLAQSLLVLRPPERSTKRQEIWASLATDWRDWRKAAKSLKATHPQAAKLDRLFFKRLAEASGPPEVRKVSKKLTAPPRTKAVSRFFRSPWWWIFLAGSGLRILAANFFSDSTSTPARNNFDQPAIQRKLDFPAPNNPFKMEVIPPDQQVPGGPRVRFVNPLPDKAKK